MTHSGKLSSKFRDALWLWNRCRSAAARSIAAVWRVFRLSHVLSLGKYFSIRRVIHGLLFGSDVEYLYRARPTGTDAMNT